METIINQIMASQGLSAVAVLALFNLLFIIIYAFFIGSAFDAIKARQIHQYKVQQEVEQELELLKASHAELNKTFSRERRADSSAIIDLDRKLNTLQQIVKEDGTNDIKLFEEIGERFEKLEGVYSEVEKLIKTEEPKNKNEVKKPKFLTAKPKFKIGDKLKNNKGTFSGVVKDKMPENGKYIYLVSNPKTGNKWYSESTLRKQ